MDHFGSVQTYEEMLLKKFRVWITVQAYRLIPVTIFFGAFFGLAALAPPAPVGQMAFFLINAGGWAWVTWWTGRRRFTLRQTIDEPFAVLKAAVTRLQQEEKGYEDYDLMWEAAQALQRGIRRSGFGSSHLDVVVERPSQSIRLIERILNDLLSNIQVLRTTSGESRAEVVRTLIWEISQMDSNIQGLGDRMALVCNYYWDKTKVLFMAATIAATFILLN